MTDRTPLQIAKNRWRMMLLRCTDPSHPRFADYGGRGITVCDDWLDFDRYYADVGDAPPGTSLDRIDNDRGYEPGNVRWSSRSTQSRNRRRTAYAAQTSRTHCPEGHPYDEANTYRHDGHRYCRACNAAAAKARRVARREQQGIRGAFNDHSVRRHPDGGWGCKCGVWLASTQENARFAMPTHRVDTAAPARRAS